MNIYQKMSAVTAELQTVAKNLIVQQTKTSSYRAVSERDVLDAVKPLEAKYGIYSYPSSRDILESNMLESEIEYQGKIVKKTTFMIRIKTVYRFVNIDNPEEFVETITFAEGIDSQDKGSGKAMTYADKYALMKVYKISTGDDPDQTASKEENYVKSNKGYGRVIKSQIEGLFDTAKEKGYTEDSVRNGIKKRYKKEIEELNQSEYQEILDGYMTIDKRG
nr:MAG TPA: ERF superfamily protein [Caudoviricetes sp.]